MPEIASVAAGGMEKSFEIGDRLKNLKVEGMTDVEVQAALKGELDDFQNKLDEANRQLVKSAESGIFENVFASTMAKEHSQYLLALERTGKKFKEIQETFEAAMGGIMARRKAEITDAPEQLREIVTAMNAVNMELDHFLRLELKELIEDVKTVEGDRELFLARLAERKDEQIRVAAEEKGKQKAEETKIAQNDESFVKEGMGNIARKKQALEDALGGTTDKGGYRQTERGM